MWGLLVKFIDDAIKGSEETIENSAPKKSNDDLDEELLKIISESQANIIVVGTGLWTLRKNIYFLWEQEQKVLLS